jgi:multidrug resistance efflux pump
MKQPALTLAAPRRPGRVPRVARVAAGLGAALLAVSLAGAALALRSGDGASTSGGTPAQPPASDVLAVASGHVDVEGGVTPVAPVQPGRVTRVDAHEGSPVAAGKPLFRLDDTVPRLQADEARAALAGALVRRDEAGRHREEHAQQVKAQQEAVRGATAAAAAAESQYRQAKRRSENRSGSEEDAATAKQMWEKAKAARAAEEYKLAALKAQDPDLAVKLAEKDVEARQAELRRAEEAVKECVVNAPFNGTPLRVLVTVGEVAGANTTQPAVLFCPDEAPVVRAEVEQEFAGRVEKARDRSVRIEDDATGTGLWRGRVKRLSGWYAQRRSVLHEPLQLNDVRTLECIVTLEPEDLKQAPLRIGQRVRVLFLKSPGEP